MTTQKTPPLSLKPRPAAAQTVRAAVPTAKPPAKPPTLRRAVPPPAATQRAPIPDRKSVV